MSIDELWPEMWFPPVNLWSCPNIKGFMAERDGTLEGYVVLPFNTTLAVVIGFRDERLENGQ